MKASKNLKRLLIAWSAAISIVISSVPFVQYKPVYATDLDIIQNNTFWKDTQEKIFILKAEVYSNLVTLTIGTESIMAELIHMLQIRQKKIMTLHLKA